MRFQKDFKNIKKVTDDYFMPYVVCGDNMLNSYDARMLSNLLGYLNGSFSFDSKYFDYCSEIFTVVFDYNYKVNLFFFDSHTDQYKIVFMRYYSYRTNTVHVYKYLVSCDAFIGDKFDTLFYYYCKTFVRVTEKASYFNI